MKKELATYILKLNEAAQLTRRAEDRPLYEKYIASAAIILALFESNTEKEPVRKAVEEHERLLGHTWLVDEVYKSPSDDWQKIRAKFHEFP